MYLNQNYKKPDMNFNHKYIYHGTSTKHLQQILKDRKLKPTETQNYELKSRSGFIYLTDLYPTGHAINATKEEGEKAVITRWQN